MAKNETIRVKPSLLQTDRRQLLSVTGNRSVRAADE